MKYCSKSAMSKCKTCCFSITPHFPFFHQPLSLPYYSAPLISLKSAALQQNKGCGNLQ